MATVDMKNFLKNNPFFLDTMQELYGSADERYIDRAAALIKKHNGWCPGETLLFSSPGRIEVIGNHTDHNNGKVIAAAVTVDTLAAVTKTGNGKIIVKSEGYADVYVDCGDLAYHREEEGTTPALVRGILKSFCDRGYRIGSFSATTTSSVFKGAGMSSSASFEVLVTEILNRLYNYGTIPAVERAIISQFAENKYFGKPSGLMDQTAVAVGGISFIDFKDTAAPAVEKLSWAFPGVSAVVINCGGDHCDLTANYSAIKSEMESAAALFGEKKLRFVSEDMFYGNLKKVHENLSGRATLRAMHYFEENRRVDRMVRAVKEKNEKEVFGIINESGLSSYCKLQNLYPEGDPAEPVPFALQAVGHEAGVLASRVHGGGFAGTILVFVKSEVKDAFVQKMGTVFGEQNVFAVNIRESGAVQIPV